MPVTFAEDATGDEAKADETRVTPDEKDGSARCETVKKVATELTKPSEKYQATAATELCGLPDRCCAPLLALALLRFTALRASVRESPFTRTPELTC